MPPSKPIPADKQTRPDLYLKNVVLSPGTVVETFETEALVEFCDDEGKTLALLEVPYALIAVVPAA